MCFSKQFRACMIMPVLVAGLLISFSIKADINWLLSNQNVDGSISLPTDLSSQYQSTVESFETLHHLSPTTDLTNVLAFINSNTFTTTKNLSRKIIANSLSGINTDNLVTQLVSAQNEDSGWGELSGYNSTTIDTALALQALSAVQYSDPAIISTALAYLYSQQMPNGGFAHSSTNDSAIFVTAHASIALQKYQLNYNISNYITAANTYLLNTELVSGGWSTPWETATALMAIVPITTDASLYLNAKNALESSQQANGSWLNVNGISDVYVTALALRALYLTANTKLPSLPTEGTFTGKITNASTASPIEWATVKMSNGVTTKTTTTSKEGRFTFKNVEPGDYQFTYSSPGLSVEIQTASVQAGQQVDLGTTALSVTPVNGVIQGTVVDAVTKQPLSGVSIQVSGATTVNVVTDGAGQYSAQIPAGSVTLTASLQNYIDSTATASLQSGQVVNFSPALFTTLPVDPTVTLSGLLIDATNNSVITNGVITITGSSNVQTVSDANGQFKFTGLTAGSMTLSMTAQGYNTVSVSLVATEGAQANIGDIQLTPLPTTGTVKGVVTDVTTNLPLAGVNIQIAGTTIVNTVTDNKGQYSVSIEPGDITITASLTDYISTTATGSVIAGQSLTFSPNLSKTPPLDTTITLTGRVIDVKDNSPIANATLMLSGTTNLQTTSDANGQFTFTGLRAGTVTISISAENYHTEMNIYILADGNNASLGDVLMRTTAPSIGSTVSGYVYDVSSGSPISGAEIKVMETAQTAITDNSGFYSLLYVAELDFSLVISATGYLGQTTSVSLVEPTTTSINVNLEPAVTNGFSILNLNTVKSDYRSHENIDVSIVLDNKSTEEKQVKALLELRNANNELVQNLSVTDGINNNVEGGNVSHAVLSGTELPLTSQWFTSSYPPGTYQLYLKVFDDITNVLLAERQATFIVNPTEEIATLTLKTTPKFASVGEEVQLSLSADFLNKSNIDTSLSLSYDFKDINGVLIQSGQSNHVIEVSKTQGDFKIITFPYTFPDSGSYQVSVTLLSGNVVTTNMEKVISVAPSVRIEATQSITPQVVVPDGDKRIKIRIQLKGVEAK